MTSISADLPVNSFGSTRFGDSTLTDSYQLKKVLSSSSSAPSSSSLVQTDSDYESDTDLGLLLPKPRPLHLGINFRIHRRLSMASTSTKVGHALAKVLGIKLQYRNEFQEEIRRGESVISVQTADTYVEEEPRSIEWVQDVLPTRDELTHYVRSLFPFLHWIGRYNLQWLIGDLVAGN